MIEDDTCGHTSTLPPFYLVFLMAMFSLPLTILIAGPPAIMRNTAGASANMFAKAKVGRLAFGASWPPRLELAVDDTTSAGINRWGLLKAKEVAVTLSKLMFLLIVWTAIYHDAKNVLSTFDATRGFWGRVHCANLIVTTGGMANYFKAAGILHLLQLRIHWKSGHNGQWKGKSIYSAFEVVLTDYGFSREVWAEVFGCQGKVVGIMLMSAYIFYLPWVTINKFLYVLPAMFVYIWVILPLAALINFCVVDRATPWLISFVGNQVLRNRNGETNDYDYPESDLLSVEPDDEEGFQKLVAWVAAVAEFPEHTQATMMIGAAQRADGSALRPGALDYIFESWYPQTKEQFDNTGAPGAGWKAYVFPLMVSNFFVQVSTTIMVEWYSGSGYLAALSNTFWNRHLIVWSGTLVANATHTYQQAWMYVFTQSF